MAIIRSDPVQITINLFFYIYIQHASGSCQRPKQVLLLFSNALRLQICSAKEIGRAESSNNPLHQLDSNNKLLLVISGPSSGILFSSEHQYLVLFAKWQHTNPSLAYNLGVFEKWRRIDRLYSSFFLYLVFNKRGAKQRDS